MEPEKLLEALHTAEKLKDTTRHCYTSKGRHESVAEHSWRIALMAFWLRDEFPQADMDKVIRMCLIHDLGECFTGDIPAFDKTAADEAAEEALLSRWVDSLPEPVCTEMRTLYAEMAALQTTEAKIYKALDKMEAVVQHNESAIATWEPQEYAWSSRCSRPICRRCGRPSGRKRCARWSRRARHRSRENGIKILLAGRIEGDDSADRRKPNARNVLLSVPTNGA